MLAIKFVLFYLIVTFSSLSHPSGVRCSLSTAMFSPFLLPRIVSAIPIAQVYSPGAIPFRSAPKLCDPGFPLIHSDGSDCRSTNVRTTFPSESRSTNAGL